jgi:hypothetical protein
VVWLDVNWFDSYELLIYIKDSLDTTIRKVFPVKITQPRSGAVLSNVVFFL